MSDALRDEPPPTGEPFARRNGVELRVIVSGGRAWGHGEGEDSYSVCSDALSATLCRLKPTVIVQGGCRTGADYIARCWAEAYTVPYETFKADWKRYGPAAGPRRNAEMIAAGADYLVVCPGGRGTLDCVRRAEAAGLKVIHVRVARVEPTAKKYRPLDH